jgi:protein-disulfide isomerase
MSSEDVQRTLKRHDRVVLGSVIVGASALSVFRVGLELGYAPKGSLLYQGVPFEYLIMAGYLLVVAVRLEARRARSTAHQLRVTLYEWWVCVLGMGGLVSLLLIYHQAGATKTMSIAYWLACGSVVAIFLSASIIPRNQGLVLGEVTRDLIQLLTRATTTLCTAAALALVAAGPRSSEVPLSGSAFARWYDRLPQVSIPAELQPAAVTLLEFVDYQCPVCRSADAQYQKILEDVSLKYGQRFAFVQVDFPLENECNGTWGRLGKRGGLHPAACEAAAAVLLARTEHPSVQRAVVEWMWANQPELKTDHVFDGVKAQFGFDVRPRYQELRTAIVRSVEHGQRLGVSATPTFFLNGRRLPFLRADVMLRALEIEMTRSSAPRG